MDSKAPISTSDMARASADIPNAQAQIAGLIFPLMLVDPQGNILEANPETENLLGRSAKRMIGRPLVEVIEPLDPRLEEQLSREDAVLIARDITIGSNGRELRVNLSISALPNHQGWRIVTLSQIGREDNADAGESSVAKGAPSILAHEIKNPLAAIRGAGQLVERKLDPADRKLARMITDEVDRIARLIDRMQQLGSSAQEEPTPCNLHEAIRSAIATVRAAGDGSGAGEGIGNIHFIEEFDPSLPPILAQRDALEQVLINLLSNARDAVKHLQQGSVSIKTRFVSGLAYRAIRKGQAVQLPIEVTISDNGSGVEPQMRDHIFEPFVTSKKGGQGLGLALVRKLMGDMNGSISHERDNAAGLTHFRLHLPLAKQENA